MEFEIERQGQVEIRELGGSLGWFLARLLSESYRLPPSPLKGPFFYFYMSRSGPDQAWDFIEMSLSLLPFLEEFTLVCSLPHSDRSSGGDPSIWG